MSDLSPPPVQPPSLAAQLVGLSVRHVLTGVAGALAVHGAIATSDESQFVSIGGALVLGAIAWGWSALQKVAAKNKLCAAIMSPASTVSQ